MDVTALHIEYLLEYNECVVFPGIGSFIKRIHRSAYIREAGEITPPYKEISFNSSIVYDDGLLASSISRRENCSYNEAARRIEQAAAIVRNQLNAGLECPIGTIGALTVQPNGNLLFTPSKGRVNPLPTIRIKPLQIHAHEITEITDLKAQKYSNLKTVLRYAAAVAIMAIVLFVATTPIKMQNDVALASMLPVENIEKPAPEANEPQLFVVAPPSDVHEQYSQSKICQDISGKYCLVIASLANLSQVETFMRDAGCDAIGYFEANGRYRVYAMVANNISEVHDPIIEHKYPGAWPCKM